MRNRSPAGPDRFPDISPDAAAAWDDLRVDGLATIDVGPLLRDPDGPGGRRVAAEIDRACRTTGFFRIAGHGAGGLDELERLARDFFAQPDEVKQRWAMRHGGRAWRGWFGVGDELTSGVPDRKEGLYFGAEHGPDHPRVRAGVPLHGANMFPSAEWRGAVLGWLDRMTELAHVLMGAIAVGLGLERDWFHAHLTTDPTVLLRIFHYPPTADTDWGVGEHTDYGLLTILAQDGVAGLQVHAPTGWLDVPPDADVLVCNLGDMLERLTGGLYRSTPHRVRNNSGRGRISIPFFFDPSWDAVVPRLPLPPPAAAARRRWDAAEPQSWPGSYGDYLTAKVAKVFPELFDTL